MRLMGSPAKAFGVDAVTGNPRREEQPFHAACPGAGAAEEDLPAGDIGYPASKRDQLRHAGSRRAEDRGRSTPRSGHVRHVRPFWAAKTSSSRETAPRRV